MSTKPRTRMCVICRKLIDPERAEAMPHTDLCSEHGEAIKRFGGEMKVVAVQENLSKPNSMKPNPGGVHTRMVRNDEAIRKLKDEYEQQRG
ncbi:MAG: hypothetical protein SFU86_16305 [Pirellulaceae bacterium]|nr:hypothetical protein [Pirellulaceae bacterium]